MLSKQKLYEKMIMLSVEYAACNEENILFDVVESLSDNASFEEVCLVADLKGIHIPPKENFELWGENYLCQCLCMLESCHEYQAMDEFLESVFGLEKLRNLVDDKFANVCYDIYFDNVMNDHDIAKILSRFILKYFVDKEFFKDFYIIAHNTGLFDGIDYLDFLKLNPENKRESYT